jgi:hypothetical protein
MAFDSRPQRGKLRSAQQSTREPDEVVDWYEERKWPLRNEVQKDS